MISIPRLLASSSSSFSSFNPAGEGRKEVVYVAAVPMRVSQGPAQMAVSAAYSAGLWDLQHWMVIIKPSHHHSQTYAFDFQPKDTEDIQVVLADLTQKQLPGVVLKRKIKLLGFLNEDVGLLDFLLVPTKKMMQVPLMWPKTSQMLGIPI